MKKLKLSWKKVNLKNWKEVFQIPRPITLGSFKTGTVVINKRGALNPQHARAWNVEDQELEVPILAHWVHHEQKGDYLLDVGLDASYHQDPRGGLQGSELDEFYQNENENIAYHVAKNKIRLKGVFLSHLHADHVAGQREIPHNIPYVIGKGEYDDYRPELYGDFLEGMDSLQEVDFSQANDMPPLGPSVDLLGDGSLWAVLTPGHTSGHMSFLVNGLDGPVFLTMDAACIYENLERGVAPSDYTWNVEMAQESLEKIVEFLKEYPQVRVGPGHEFLKLL
jgi:N-acyl homoserine lactone hydrolase